MNDVLKLLKFVGWTAQCIVPSLKGDFITHFLDRFGWKNPQK